MSKAEQSRAKTNRGKKSLKQWTGRHKKILIIAVVALLAVEVLFIQYSRYVYNIVKCGNLPVSTISNPFSSSSSGYDFPGESGYTVRATTKYYCTPEDAENRGIAPSPLSEKGLERQKELKQQGNWPPRRKG